MYVCVCAVAGGSSVDEILLPCQIKASAAISVTVEVGSCSHNALISQAGRQMRRLKIDMQCGKQGF